MELQPDMLAVNTLPKVFAQRNGSASGPEAAPPVVSTQPVKPIVNGFFISPLLQFDNQAMALIFQVRDAESGDIQRQFPRESVVERLRSNPDSLAIRIAAEQAGLVGGEPAPEPVELPIIGGGNATGSEDGGAGAEEIDTVGIVGGAEVSNGAPSVGGTAADVAPALGAGNQGVNFLV